MKHCLIAWSLLLLSSSVFCQDFDTAFSRYSKSYNPERIYMHYDKSTYVAGDTIWFKAYLMSGVLPAIESKTLYIDWTDADGKLFKRTSSPIVGGVTFGQIVLTPEWKSSFIHARAYTKWMLNFDTAFLFNKDIRIFSANKSPHLNVVTSTQLTLFPEGGQIIEGLPNKIAFKANDQYGIPVNIKGQLLENNKSIETLKVLHDGMGFFYLNPGSGNKYVVEWTDEKGKKYSTPLLEIRKSGMSMQIGELTDRKTFLISATKDLTNSGVHIIGTMYHQPVFNISRNFVEGAVQGVIPVTSLPSGVLTITVLDNNYHPLAERITFINNGEYKIQPEMTVQHWGLNQRARNEIEIEVPDSIVTNLSVSVTDLGIDYDSSNNIISSLMLQGELKGKIYNPSYYFNNQSDSVASFLDLVMLTHGWRKISWSDIASEKFPEIKYPRDTSYETISGKIYGRSTLQLQNMEDLVLIISEKHQNDILPVSVNPDGTFNTGKLLFDTAKIYYQLPKKARGKIQFMQNKLPSVLSPINAGTEFYSSADTSGWARHEQLASELAYQIEKYKAKVLETVTITAKKIDPKVEMDKKYTSGFFSGGSGTSLDLLNDPSAISATSIFDYIQGKIAGVTITPGSPPTISWRMGTPALFLNEFPISADALADIPVNNIAYVKALPPPFMGAIGGGGNGAIAVYTRKGGDESYDSDDGLPSNTVSGYSVIRQFYSPDYLMKTEDKKDLRTTLYWNPEVITKPGQEKVLLTWYNNDISTAFRVVIEGMTEDGRLVHVVKTME